MLTQGDHARVSVDPAAGRPVSRVIRPATAESGLSPHGAVHNVRSPGDGHHRTAELMNGGVTDAERDRGNA